MSIVKNEPKYKNGLLQAIREQLEHRAYWLYLLFDLLSAAAGWIMVPGTSKRETPTA